MKISAYAVATEAQGLIAATVSATRRAAMVNFLVAVAGEFINNRHTDDYIEMRFTVLRNSPKFPGLRVAVVSITEDPA
jgi:hypothetical protein